MLARLFNWGASRALSIAKALDCDCAILKARSPSCGNAMRYSGNFDGALINGEGITASQLKRAGVRVFNEAEQTAFEEFYYNERNNKSTT